MKSKNIYHPEEINFVEGYYIVNNEDLEVLNSEEVVDEVYEGPSVEEIKKEIEKLRSDLEIEHQELILKANIEAKEIIENAKEEAKRTLDETSQIKEDLLKNSNASAKMIISNAEEQAKLIVENANTQSENMKQEGYKAGMSEGSDEGYKAGRIEAERMNERLGVLISSISRKRIEIINDLENQIVELVLQIARKVVKVISENQEDVVISNIYKALEKLRTKTHITIRVNLKNLDSVSAHKKEFIERIENISSVSIIEDNGVAQGGCIIETDFGELDARISSQLTEIERKIVDLAPIKSKGGTYNFK